MNQKHWILLGALILTLLTIFFAGFGRTTGSLLDFAQQAELYANLAFGACGIVLAWLLYEASTKLRFRYVYMLLGSILTLSALFITSPDQTFLSDLSYGASFIATIVLMLRAVLYVAILHFSRKALFDYIDLEELYLKAKTEPLAAAVGMVAIAISLIPVALLIVAAVGN